MSSSFPDRKICNRATGSNFRVLVLAAAVGAVALVGVAEAQDGYIIPEVRVGIEHHDNLQFSVDPQADESVEGYVANVGATLGWRGPRGRTEVRPRVVFQEYPDRDEMQRSNQYLDLRSNYDFLRSEFNLVGSYSREDEYHAEIAQAGFNDFDPTDPTTDQSGQIILLSQTRSRVQVRPDFLYHFNDRLGAGVDGVFQNVSYDADISSLERTGYRYTELQAYLQWTLTQRTDLLTGLYGGRYSAEDNQGDANSKGVSLEVRHRWTEIWAGTVTAKFEKSEEDIAGTNATEDSSNWGLDVGLVRQGQISQFRLTAGRTFTPTSTDSRAQVDQIRAQYSWNLTQRWAAYTAARWYSRQSLDDASSNDRTYISGDVGLRWNVTRTWFVNGGYSYVRQKYENESDSRVDQVARLEIGYRGLSPQQ